MFRFLRSLQIFFQSGSKPLEIIEKGFYSQQMFLYQEME
jgi:hypothetical protein